jgi:hypothetical protein
MKARYLQYTQYQKSIDCKVVANPPSLRHFTAPHFDPPLNISCQRSKTRPSTQRHLESARISLDLRILLFELINIPIRPEKFPFQKISFRASKPHRKMRRQVHGIIRHLLRNSRLDVHVRIDNTGTQGVKLHIWVFVLKELDYIVGCEFGAAIGRQRAKCRAHVGDAAVEADEDRSDFWGGVLGDEGAAKKVRSLNIDLEAGPPVHCVGGCDGAGLVQVTRVGDEDVNRTGELVGGGEEGVDVLF